MKATKYSKREARSRIRALRLHAGGPSNRAYDRRHDLPRLLPLLAEDLEATTTDDQLRLVRMLRRALRAERQRAASRLWTYSPARHAALLQAARHETALIADGRR